MKVLKIYKNLQIHPNFCRIFLSGLLRTYSIQCNQELRLISNQYKIYIQQSIKSTFPMDDSDNSNMFKVDHSQQYVHESSGKRMDNFFDKDKKILNDGQKRMVVYGAMDKEPRTIYQIVQPYVLKAAAVTGEAAIYAGKGIYTALATGANWVYDKFVNTVIPYTAQQLPKLFFIIKNTKKEEKVYSSDSFAVLEVEEGDYAQIKKKQNTGKNHKKRVIIPMGENDDPEFIKFLEKQNYIADNSFPIDADSDQSETFMIPSANFVALHNEAIKKILPAPAKNMGIAQYETQEIAINPKQESQPEEQKQPVQQKNNNIRSYIDEMVSIKEVEDYKKVSKKVFKLKDCYMFELEGKNSIEYELLDGIEKDQQTKCGFLVKSNHFNLQKIQSGSDDNPSFSGEVPLIIEKVVDKDIKVRVQIPSQKVQQRSEQKKQEQFLLA